MLRGAEGHSCTRRGQNASAGQASSFVSTGKPGSYRSTFSWVETKLWKSSLMTTSTGAATYPSRSGWKEITIIRTRLRSPRN